ncbi:MAG: glycosyltransferase family 2 protein, partial [Methyloprofundus sp.]|nr:glycosyltransferase family 2 protein [Methyloprofundus sp.]
SNAEVAKFTDPRIRVFHRDEPGPGGYAARNLGIKEAKAEWIAFLDADDEWYPEHLQNSKKIIGASDDISFLAAGFEEIDKGVKVNGLKSNTEGYKKLSFDEYLSYSPFYTSTVVAKRELFLSVDLFPEGKMKRGGDVDTWLRAIEKAGGYIMSSHIGAKYYRDSENMVTRQNFYTEAEIENRAIKDLIENYKESPLVRKLMIKFNNQVIYAWNQNMHLGIKRNFSLRGRLYFKVQPVKVGFYLMLSSLPLFILKPLHRLLFKVVSIKRKLVK